MKRTIENPNRVTHNFYVSLLVIFLILMAIALYFCELGKLIIIADVIKNLSYGCVASTVVAWMIDCISVRNLNVKANNLYDVVYTDLEISIAFHIEVWSQVCAAAFENCDYKNKKFAWHMWYEEVKLQYKKLDVKKQKDVLHFMQGILLESAKLVKKSIEQIQGQKYMLTMNDMMNSEIERIIEDFNFEFHALELSLSNEYDDKHFWSHMDAIVGDLKMYINNWEDIRYYNYLEFQPYKFRRNTEDIMKAIEEMNKSNM